MTASTNGYYETTGLALASFLYAKGVRFVGFKWLDTRQAVFLFDQPPAEILAAWMLDEGKFIKRYEDAKNALRDRMESER